MTAALRIGHVGVLATFLGIGFVIADGSTGVAWADDAAAATAGPQSSAMTSAGAGKPVPSDPLRGATRRSPTPPGATVARQNESSPAAFRTRRPTGPAQKLPAAAATALDVGKPTAPQRLSFPTRSLSANTTSLSKSIPGAPPVAAVAAAGQVAAASTTARASGNPLAALFSGFASALFNQSPGVRSTQSPQTGNGVISGTLIAYDPDSAPLAYAVTTKPVHGTVTLGADGSFTYTADPSAGPTGTADLFRVTVSDANAGFHIHGPGGLINLFSFGLIGAAGHTATTTVNLTISPFTDPPPISGELSTFCGCTLMPANTVFHANVSTLPVLTKSTTWTTLLAGNLSAIWGGDPWQNVTGGMPVNIAGATLPKEKVIFNRGLTTSGPTIDDRLYAIPDRPLVEGMPNVPAWDRHLLVFQEGTCTSQELYNVANGVELPANSVGDALANSIYANQYGSAWIAEAGVQYDMNSALYPAKGEANASQLPYLPLILRPDDLTRGSIDHMLGIVIAKDRGTGYTWPARSGDGTGTDPDGVPMGTVFRLRADFDISGYDPATQVVLRALKEHGAVVYDSFGAGQNGARLMAMSNGWTGTEYLRAQRQLSTIPISAFEAVDVLSLAADPATGWMIRSTV